MTVALSIAVGGAAVTAKEDYLRCFSTRIAAGPGSVKPAPRRHGYIVIAVRNYPFLRPRNSAAAASQAPRREAPTSPPNRLVWPTNPVRKIAPHPPRAAPSGTLSPQAA